MPPPLPISTPLTPSCPPPPPQLPLLLHLPTLPTLTHTPTPSPPPPPPHHPHPPSQHSHHGPLPATVSPGDSLHGQWSPTGSLTAPSAGPWPTRQEGLPRLRVGCRPRGAGQRTQCASNRHRRRSVVDSAGHLSAPAVPSSIGLCVYVANTTMVVCT